MDAKSRISLTSASIIVFIINIGSRVFGFVREATIASFYGTENAYEVFIIAFTVPEFIVMILLTAMPAALIPHIRKHVEQIPRIQLFIGGILVLLCVLLPLGGVATLLDTQLLGLFAIRPGTTDFQLASQMYTYLVLYILFKGVEVYCTSWLYAERKFVLPAGASIIMNIGIVLGITVLAPERGVVALVVGFLSGSLLSMVVALAYAVAVIRKSPQPIAPAIKWGSRLIHLLAITVVIEAIAMIYPVIDRFFAAQFLSDGYIAALKYANFLISIPIGTFVVALNTAYFPWITDYYNKSKWNSLGRIYSNGTAVILLVFGFATPCALFFSKEIITLALQRGVFDIDAIHKTMLPFSFFAVGMTFRAQYAFQMRFLYASQSYRELLYIRLVMLFIKTVASWTLLAMWGVKGLILATTVAWFCGFLLFSAVLAKRECTNWTTMFFNRDILKIVAVVAAVAAYWGAAKVLLPLNSPLVQFIALFVTGGLLYAVFSYWLKIGVFMTAFTKIVSKISIIPSGRST